MSASIKIPVWRTVLDSWRLAINRAPGMLRVAWLSFILTAILHTAVYGSVPKDAGLPTGILVTLLTAIPLTMLLVPWHRNVLLDQQPVGGIALWRVQIRHIRFLWRWALLGVLPPIVLLTLNLATSGQSPSLAVFGTALILLVTVGLMYISFRIALVLPAAALGHADRFDRAWQLGEGNGWRLLGIGWLAMLPLLIPAVALGMWIPRETPPDASSLLVLIIVAIIFVLNGLIAATATALCYRWLGGMEGGGAEPGNTE